MELHSVSWKTGIPSTGEPRSGTVESVNRALALLELLANSGVSLPLGRIAKELRLPPSTAHRLLRTLQTHGYIHQATASDRYQATLKLFHLGSIVRGRYHYLEAVLPWMRRIANQVRESVTLMVREGWQGILIERVESSEGVQVFAKFPRVPLYCTAAGKSLLSLMPKETLEQYLGEVPLVSHTPNTITDPAVLRRRIVQIGLEGYAVDDAELQQGIRCVAVPLALPDGSQAALAVTGLDSHLPKGQIPRIANLLKTAKDQLANF